MTESNIIALKVQPARQPLPQRLAAHAKLFAQQRRDEQDVFWLKENAEFLNITECTGQDGALVLEVYQPFYNQIEDRLGAFPQYYRFLLSICLDLEDLGMPGDKGAALCGWAHQQGLVHAELSDLQRAEAARLFARRGIAPQDQGLDVRLHGFIDRSQTFAIPNKKAAYELTHIVFYLSEYGRRDPKISAAAVTSLTYAGLQAYLDQNYDLLAEICVAMIYAGHQPSPIWKGAVMAALQATFTSEAGPMPVFDDYHAYLVSSWMAATVSEEPMRLVLPAGSTKIEMPHPPARPLRDMSTALDDIRATNWGLARRRLFPRLDSDARALLDAAERSTDLFEQFYEGFSRASHPGTA